MPEEFTGTVIDKLSQRKGELQNMGAYQRRIYPSGIPYPGTWTDRIPWRIPNRYKRKWYHSIPAFDGYAPYKGDITYRKQGSLIAFETGESVTYGLFSAQERGVLFIGAGEKVYSGMVIGENAKADDIEVNVCKTKHLTNTRSSSADEALRLTPPKVLSLEAGTGLHRHRRITGSNSEKLKNP